MTGVKFCKRESNMYQEPIVDWNNYLRDVREWRFEQENENKYHVRYIYIYIMID